MRSGWGEARLTPDRRPAYHSGVATRFFSVREVLALCALAFFCGGVLVGVAIYWPLISQTLFPGE